MTYDEYISYHMGGDAGVEEKMIASLCSHFKLSRWNSFRLVYYYTTTYHIPSALKLLQNHNTPKKELKFRTDRRYVRIGDTYDKIIRQLSPALLEELDEAETTTEQYRIVSNWYFFGRYATFLFLEVWAKISERGVPSPLSRLEAIRRIAEADAGGATLRLRPFIIGITTPTYLDLIKEAHQRGATAMSTEFFCLEQRSPTLKTFIPTINELAGFDVMAFYKKYSVQSGYLRLNRKVKEPFMRNMKDLCDKLGMRFYVSDAHFKEFCCNGSCCGLPPTWNYSRGQWCEALQIAKNNPKGIVTWDDISKDIEMLVSGFQWREASGYNCNSTEKRAKYDGMSMRDYMNYLWNNPQNGQSPYKLFEGALQPAGKDENDNIIYEFKGAR